MGGYDWGRLCGHIRASSLRSGSRSVHRAGCRRCLKRCIGVHAGAAQYCWLVWLTSFPAHRHRTPDPLSFPPFRWTHLGGARTAISNQGRTPSNTSDQSAIRSRAHPPSLALFQLFMSRGQWRHRSGHRARKMSAARRLMRGRFRGRPRHSKSCPA